MHVWINKPIRWRAISEKATKNLTTNTDNDSDKNVCEFTKLFKKDWLIYTR